MRNTLQFLAAAVCLGSGVKLTMGASPSTDGLLLWLDSSQSSSITTSSGNSVQSWTNLAPGSSNAVTYTGTNDNGTLATYNTDAPTYIAGPVVGGPKVLSFDGNGYLDNLNFSSATPEDLTVFILASPQANPGDYSAFMAFNQSIQDGTNDYQTGLNVDQGQNPTTSFSRLNVEGAKAGGNGGFQLADGSNPFGPFYTIQVDDGGADNATVSTYINDVYQNSVTGSAADVNLDELYIGARSYANGFDPGGNNDFVGDIAAVLVYNGNLTGDDLTQTQNYLANFFDVPEPVSVSMFVAATGLLAVRRRSRH